jgi:asparagine synthase (glutamine-hydrolysing)
MCGIAGIIGLHLDRDRSESSCQAMLRALHHRGPDASGIYHDPAGQAHLVHARLSILDLLPRSNQPLHRGDHTSIVFNGEIYNHQIVRQRLESQGVLFQTESDTEVILALYEKDGLAGFQELRGMYAFAIWDHRKKTCILARDPFGIKPLYYAQHSGGLLFASEIKALLSSGLIQAKLCPEGVAAYLRWGSVDQNISLLQGVQSVPPGCCLQFRENQLQQTVFQTIPREPRLPDQNIIDFRTAFLDSVSAHLVSDVPVGLFLSGGLDSSSLLAACQILGKSDTPLFTLSFPGTSTDESPITQRVASFFNKNLLTETPDPLELSVLFSDFLASQDLPSIDGFNTYCISRAAARQGMKVILSGLGGDELLGSYPSFERIPRWTSFAKVFSRIPGNASLNGLLTHVSGNKGARLAEFLSGSPNPFRAYLACRSLFTNQEIQSILQGLELSPASVRTAESEMTTSPYHISHCEASAYMKNQLLRDADACSMKHGLELRVPFVDMPLWRSCAGLPAHLRYEKGKKILQRALPEMPSWLFTLPKKGFSLPYARWRRQELASFFTLEFPSPLTYQPTWYQEMALLSLHHWRKSLGV